MARVGILPAACAALVALVTAGASARAGATTAGGAPAAGRAVANAATSSVPSCGYVHASVPYTSHGQAEKWRVYVKGDASCATAVKVLDAVMHLRGKQHLGSSEAGSYFTYDGWLCPFGDMGTQTCELPAHLPAHPPIRAHALALDCTTFERGCPARVPSAEL